MLGSWSREMVGRRRRDTATALILPAAPGADESPGGRHAERGEHEEAQDRGDRTRAGSRDAGVRQRAAARCRRRVAALRVLAWRGGRRSGGATLTLVRRRCRGGGRGCDLLLGARCVADDPGTDLAIVVPVVERQLGDRRPEDEVVLAVASGERTVERQSRRERVGTRSERAAVGIVQRLRIAELGGRQFVSGEAQLAERALTGDGEFDADPPVGRVRGRLDRGRVPGEHAGAVVGMTGDVRLWIGRDTDGQHGNRADGEQTDCQQADEPRSRAAWSGGP